MEDELKSIKRWIAFGAIGFFLIGVGIVVFSISMYSMTKFAEEYGYKNTEPCKQSFTDKVSCVFEKGEYDKVLTLAEEREKNSSL